ncbi:MAG: DUF4926 domain-containing protein [Hyphomicrobium sp.]
MIEELDRVALTRAVPEHGLIAGDIGAVVGVHQDGKGFTLEFLSFDGKTIAIVTLDAGGVRPLADREIAHARAVA